MRWSFNAPLSRHNAVSWLVSRAAVYLMAALFAVIGFLIWAAIIAHGQQHDHNLYHADYQKWRSDLAVNCCDNEHCGIVDDDHLRENGDHLEVLVADPKGDQWCPVTPRHLIRQDNGLRQSPDPSHAHACILTGPAYTEYAACKRFLCFMDKARD